jgi:hypothetical protein
MRKPPHREVFFQLYPYITDLGFSFLCQGRDDGVRPYSKFPTCIYSYYGKEPFLYKDVL